jgi:succinate-semialdehyde dehydrogenase/glutarate-semialdehyde dehydrogenase
MNHSPHSTIYQSVDPYTQTKVHLTPTQSIKEVQFVIDQLDQEFQKWSKRSITDRLTQLSQVLKELRITIDTHSAIISTEMGKPITAAKAEIEKCLTLLDYYGPNSEALLTPEIHGDTERVIYQPMGVILGIQPWNYPIWQVFRFAIPTLIAGNTVVIRHAHNVSLTAKSIQSLFEKTNLPILKCIFSENGDTEAIIQNPKIKGLAFTGSTNTGSIIASLAGKHIKPCVMELGGMDPFIVLSDAKMPDTAIAAASARCTNSGQVCTNAKRFIVHESLVDTFIKEYLKATEALIAGNPIDPKTTYGPLARKDIYDSVIKQMTTSIQMGAKAHTSPIPIPDQGLFIKPTLLTNLTPDMPVVTEEVFGPVAAVIPFKTIEEAIQIANNIPYGLGASIWTESKSSAEEIIPQIDAGAVFVNRAVTSLIHLPFGGTKKSGFGRELGRWGLHNFSTIKTVVTKF